MVEASKKDTATEPIELVDEESKDAPVTSTYEPKKEEKPMYDTEAKDELEGGDLSALLEHHITKLSLSSEHADTLRTILQNDNNENFDAAIKAIADELKSKSREDQERGYKLELIAPLFKKHSFWYRQRMTQHWDEDKLPDSEFDKHIKEWNVDDIQKEPYKTPEGLVWDELDLTDDSIISELHQFLKENYVEDSASKFRLEYPKELLKWALLGPAWFKDWHVGLRAKATGQLMGFVSGTPIDLRANKVKQDLHCEVNFLCVHKTLRDKKLAPLVIHELTRRVYRRGSFHAIYEVSKVIPTPFASVLIWLRSINVKKLIEIGVIKATPKQIPFYTKHYAIPEKTSLQGLRLMEEGDVEQVRDLFNGWLTMTSKVHRFWTVEEVKHFLLPKEGLLYSYVVDEGDGHITDFFSFYTMRSKILVENDAGHEYLNQAYSYYSISPTLRIEQGLRDMLVYSRDLGMDIFKCQEMLQNNSETLRNLRFGESTGMLHFYIFNWRIRSMDSSQIGIYFV